MKAPPVFWNIPFRVTEVRLAERFYCHSMISRWNEREYGARIISSEEFHPV